MQNAVFTIGETVWHKFSTDKEPKQYKILGIDPPASIPVFTYHLKTKKNGVTCYVSESILIYSNPRPIVSTREVLTETSIVIDELINNTPTGKKRNSLCDLRIKIGLLLTTN